MRKILNEHSLSTLYVSASVQSGEIVGSESQTLFDTRALGMDVNYDNLTKQLQTGLLKLTFEEDGSLGYGNV